MKKKKEGGNERTNEERIKRKGRRKEGQWDGDRRGGKTERKEAN